MRTTRIEVVCHNRCVLPLRLIRVGAMAIAGAAITLAQMDLPSRGFWDGQVPLQWASVLVVAILAFYEAIRSVNYAVRAARIRDYDNDLRAALSVVVSTVVRKTGAPWDEIAVRYYRSRGMWRRRRLTLVAAIKAGADVAEGQRTIRPGIGIVGTAFADRVIIAEEWRQFVHTATGAGPDAWEQRDARDRYGLSWGQLRRSAQPEGVVASPTFAPDGQPDGCILLSGPLKLADLTRDEIRQALDDLATVLDRLGAPPTGWWGSHEQR